ncbi:uncharacterized protein OCT59_008454 [Rhizophagus irregularis]|uniref:Uncharacterized protein n=2 Tax=Rhizophagus irregularis TaxID=588596 RepID=U9UE80_RHIID|nr:hypothetical protein GLOIN_2v1485695 [Rhizophagus irregularis DAOM 181602=DAOM 197198]EXX60411.1 hypothetical protein RirG_180080 [Rhizophagus irregularis DAOM 197198w]UZO17093.1 hypothetical protein OCT59_008454 [Rhizophagus irregularis]POG62120.1 hypothetical protein GLOIN_2v1485695 [Rhizophagus irregularis DAOM 181602=DAOM 197198]CAG8700233.1 5277_t:CDS:1 [Rhizophagus irregularis]GBC28004.1 hypothetical protein GLOIN_2v1485695 [Rhizophagus irregularis DAOM 181602=DAOM 197198]|eukprot:XP_025168986.1 hypothetical protein GLOIN_2v1485695 [Rhizophagus irregularis DAOM 181602=DAOM 197198]
MKTFAVLSYLIPFLLITISSAFPNELLNKRNQCQCSFALADFDSGPVGGLVVFNQDENGHTEVSGIFKKGFEDTNATYGFKIIDECKNTLFDLTDGLNIKPDGSGGTKSFRHKFTDMSIDCNDNGILTKKLHNSKRHCSDKLRKRLPNGAMTTQNGEGSGYAGLSK